MYLMDLIIIAATSFAAQVNYCGIFSERHIKYAVLSICAPIEIDLVTIKSTFAKIV